MGKKNFSGFPYMVSTIFIFLFSRYLFKYIILETKNVPKFENNVKSGLMVRSSLDSSSEMYLLADSWLKYGENIRVFERPVKGTAVTNSYMFDAEGTPVENVDSITYDMPKYLRMTRKGQRLTMSVSENGTDFTDNIRQPYIIEDTTLPERFIWVLLRIHAVHQP